MESVPILSNDHGQENSSAPLVPEMEEIGFQRTGYLALRPATTRYEALAGPIAAIIGGKPPQTPGHAFRLADLGCGGGELAWRLLSQYRKLFPPGRIELDLIDTDSVMLANAVRRLANMPGVDTRARQTCIWEYL